MTAKNKITNPEDFGYPQSLKDEDIKNDVPANAEVKPIAAQTSKYQELVDKYLGTKEEAPVLDQAKVERLQKMGRINTLGRGLNVLGDGLSLALGANVKRKAPDTTAPALYQSYENTLDQHTQEVKGYKQRDFQKKLSDIQFGVGRLDKETDQDYRERVQKANNEFKKVKNAQDLAKWQEEFKLKEKKNESDIERNKLTGKAAMIRANKATGSMDKSNQPVTIKTDKNIYTLSPSEASYTRGKAIENIELLKKKYPTWTVTVPKLDEWNEIIPGEFTTKLDPRIKDDDLIRAQKQLDEDDQELKNKAGSKTNATPKATTTKSLDYSKIY